MQTYRRPTLTKRKRIALIVGLAGIAAVIVLSVSAFEGVPLYTAHQDLTVNDISSIMTNTYYATNLNDSQGRRVASLVVSFPSGILATTPDTATMSVSVWHSDDTHLDSFDLTLSSPLAGTTLGVWLLPPSGGNSMQITYFGNKATIRFIDLQFYGIGSVDYDMLVQWFSSQSVPSNCQLNLSATITLHDTNALFIRQSYTARASTQFTITPDGNVTRTSF